MPTVFLPGIGATMRTLGTRRAIARSSARPVIFDSRRPASSSTSYWAITGPVSISTTFTLKPKFGKRLLQDLGLAANFLFLLVKAEFFRLVQQLDRAADRTRAASSLRLASSSCSITSCRSI